MKQEKSFVERTEIVFEPEPSRVLIRFFPPGSDDRIERIMGRVMTLDEETVEQRLNLVLGRFASRHDQIEQVFLRHYAVVEPYMTRDIKLDRNRQLLIGAYFTSEYALESAALFNPCIVEHPDQSGIEKGSLRFIISLRATGEGHVSSLEFREGIIDSTNKIHMREPGNFVTGPELVQNPSYRKEVITAKLYEMGYENETTKDVLAGLNDEFTLQEIKDALSHSRTTLDRTLSAENENSRVAILNLVEQNYEIRFDGDHPLAERIIFPRMDHDRKAIEDARFVRFVEDGGDVTYYATYTAYDGRTFLPQLLGTRDFCAFRFSTLNGDAVRNKGMALFPRRIGDQYAMLSRQDGENIFIMYSDHLHFWHDLTRVMKPTAPWEFVQLGNCGSPIETDQGWLVLTHGVGPMRRYCIGAVLLDLDDPSRVIGRLTDPLLEPDENEREGYVPNVVYTCGALIHGNVLVMPYAMADYAARIALVEVDELLERLKKSSP